MKKLVLVFGALAAMSLFSCVKDNKPVPEPIPDVEDTLQQVTGVAIDGAMNSVTLVVDQDTFDFSYPELDIEHRASWDINDTVTVRYYETENGDSVTDVINESDA